MNQRNYYSQQQLQQPRFGEQDLHSQKQRQVAPGGGFTQAPSNRFIGSAPQPTQSQGFDIGQLLGKQDWGDWSGIQAGGGATFGDGSSVQAGDQTGLAQSIVGAQSQALGNQLGLIGSLAGTQGGIEQERLRSGAQLGVAGIDAETRKYIQDALNELGIYQTDIGADTQRFGITNEAETARGATAAQLQASLANTDANRFATEQDLIARQYAADAANEQYRLADARARELYQPAFTDLVSKLFGGSTAPGLSGGGGVEVMDRNQAYANNAAQEAAALNAGGYSGGSPQAGAASQAASLNRAMADTGVATDYARDVRQAQLDQIAAESEQMRAQAAAMSPFLQLLGQYA